MLKHRLTRVLVFVMLILTSVSAMAEEGGYFDWLTNYDWKEMRYELEYGIKAKEFGDAERPDGAAGASDRSFREWYTDFTVKPFEESEFSVTAGYSKRTYTSNLKSNAKVSENVETHQKYINLGNTWVFGKLMLRPELELRHTEWTNYRRLDSTTEYRIFPKITYNLTKDWNLYTRGYFGRRIIDRRDAATKDNKDFKGHQKSRMEYGTRYKFNKEHAMSVAYSNDRTDETHYDYQIDSEQIRLRYHYTPNRKITIVPHWFIPVSGTRKAVVKDGYNPTRRGTISKARVGINANFRVTETIDLLTQVHYEWWREPHPAWSNPVKKDNIFFNLGLKHHF